MRVPQCADGEDADRFAQMGHAISTSHLPVQPILEAILPIGHGNVDAYLQDPLKYPLPTWHPRLEAAVARRGALRAGHFLLFVVAIVFSIMLMTTVKARAQKWRLEMRPKASTRRIDLPSPQPSHRALAGLSADILAMRVQDEDDQVCVCLRGTPQRGSRLRYVGGRGAAPGLDRAVHE